MFHKYSFVSESPYIASCNGRNFILQKKDEHSSRNFDLATGIVESTRLTRAVEVHEFATKEKRYVYEYGIGTLADLNQKLKSNRKKCRKLIVDVVKGVQELHANGLTCCVRDDNIVIESNGIHSATAKIGIHEGLHPCDPSDIENNDHRVGRDILSLRCVLESIVRLPPGDLRPFEAEPFVAKSWTLEGFIKTDLYKECLKVNAELEELTQTRNGHRQGNSNHCPDILNEKYANDITSSMMVVAGERGFTLFDLMERSSLAHRVEGVVTHVALATLDTVAYTYTLLAERDEPVRYLAIITLSRYREGTDAAVLCIPNEEPNEKLMAKGEWIVITNDVTTTIYTTSNGVIQEFGGTYHRTRRIATLTTSKRGELTTVSYAGDVYYWNYFPKDSARPHIEALKKIFPNEKEWKLRIMGLLNERKQSEGDGSALEKPWRLDIGDDEINENLMCLSGDGLYLAVSGKTHMHLVHFPRSRFNVPRVSLPCYGATSIAFTQETDTTQFLAVTCEHWVGWLAYRKVLVYRIGETVEKPQLIFEKNIWKTEIVALPLHVKGSSLELFLVDGLKENLRQISPGHKSQYCSLSSIEQGCYTSLLRGSNPDLDELPILNMLVTVPTENLDRIPCLLLLKKSSLFVQPYNPTARRYNFPHLISRGLLQKNDKLSIIYSADHGGRTHSLVITFPSKEAKSEFMEKQKSLHNTTNRGAKLKSISLMLPEPEPETVQGYLW